jgi:PAS domain S-box-containing protein
VSAESSKPEQQLEKKRIAELERAHARVEEELRQSNRALAESQQRFQDLFDEAPIAYVHEGLDSRFIHANKTALNILGIKPEEAVGFLGRSLAPATPEAQHLVNEALGSINRGIDTKAVLMQLCRHDTGEPIWIQWWSRPDPSGTFTRTMFIDITEVVLLEREKQALRAQNTYLQEEIDRGAFREIVGNSRVMRRVMEDVRHVAATNASVLILGETGTGKEVFARAVHEASQRAEKPLIKVNCGALPESLIESELFGHEKGAFTGATVKRDGRFSLADGGTIFLDEIGDLPFQLQVKLLRVLQEGEFEPLGSATTHQVDVRVIAATNRDLFQSVQEGEFREDLYYRLAVFPVQLPPLRDRPEDIAELVQLFSHNFAQRLGRSVQPPTEEDLARLRRYNWPGNIRELQNVIERALITSTDGGLNLDRALPETSETQVTTTDTVKTMAELDQMERDNFLQALAQTDWCIAGENGAAQLLGMNPSTLNSRLKALNIKRQTST